MSVFMTLRVKADPKRLQEAIGADESRWQAINARAKEGAASITSSWRAPTAPRSS